MASKRLSEEVVSKARQEFLGAEPDVSTVHQVAQRLELHVVGTTAYVPSYTQQVFDQNHGGPVVAIYTKTVTASKKVFIYPADDPTDQQARKLRRGDSMGPAYFAFGVPLRQLSLKFPESRRIILPLAEMEVTEEDRTYKVYWASFAELEKERRALESAGAAATRAPKKTTAPDKDKGTGTPVSPVSAG